MDLASSTARDRWEGAPAPAPACAALSRRIRIGWVQSAPYVVSTCLNSNASRTAPARGGALSPSSVLLCCGAPLRRAYQLSTAEFAAALGEHCQGTPPV